MAGIQKFPFRDIHIKYEIVNSNLAHFSRVAKSFVCVFKYYTRIIVYTQSFIRVTIITNWFCWLSTGALSEFINIWNFLMQIKCSSRWSPARASWFCNTTNDWWDETQHQINFQTDILYFARHISQIFWNVLAFDRDSLVKDDVKSCVVCTFNGVLRISFWLDNFCVRENTSIWQPVKARIQKWS